MRLQRGTYLPTVPTDQLRYAQGQPKTFQSVRLLMGAYLPTWPTIQKQAKFVKVCVFKEEPTYLQCRLINGGVHRANPLTFRSVRLRMGTYLPT